MSVFRSVSKCVLPSVHRASSVPAALMGGDSVQPYVAYKTLLVAVGDSITAGQTGVPGYPNTAGVTYHELYATNNETGLLVAENRAVGGSGLSSAAAGAAALDARIAANSGNDIYCLVVAWGRNDGDITAGSYNGGASWIDQMKTYLTNRRAAGWNKIIVCTVTPYDVESGSNTVTREAGNDLIRGLVGSGHADGCCDYGNSQTSLMGNVASHTGDTYYHDYVHPTVRGHVEMYKVFTPIANAVLTLATKTATPVISPLGGSYTENKTVSISCETEDAAIYYTLDGSTPDNTKTLYTAPFTQASGTVKAIAIKGGLTDSSINSQTFTIISGLYWNTGDIGTNMTLSADKKTALQATNNMTGWRVRTNLKVPNGKYCIEVIVVGSKTGAIYGGLGFLESSDPLTTDLNTIAVPNRFRQYTHGAMVASGATAFGYSSGFWNGTFTDGERMLFAIDIPNGKCWHSKTGASWVIGSLSLSNPVTGVQPHWTFTGSANWYFFVEPYSVGNNPNWRLPPAAEVTGTIPSGYTLLNA